MAKRKRRSSKGRRRSGRSLRELSKQRKKQRKKQYRPPVELTEEEKQVAMQELGVTPADLEVGTPTWAYFLAVGLILGASALSYRLATT